MTKRAFDLLFSALVMLFGSPFFALIAIGIKCSSRGPIFFAHSRIGKGGKPIRCYKFRTMICQADQMLAQLLQQNPLLQQEWLYYRKLRRDPRVTPIGRFLRRTSLDELPQFWNVLRGDLTVVGPRPVLQEEVAEFYKEKAGKILSVRPGITGLWQTSGRNDIPMKERVLMEETYVDNASFLMDLRLIGKTISHVLFRIGAY